MLTATLRLYKNAYTGLSLHTWYLSAVMLINRSGTMVIPFMTIYCTQALHFSLTQAGFVMGLFGFGAIVGAFIGGRITDKFGFYPQQVAALLLGGIMFIITGYLHTYLSLCIGTFILSVCNESFRPANATAVAFYSSPENVTRSFSLNRLAINLGWAVGGALGGFLASANYHLLFWVDGCTNIAAAFLLLKLLPYVKSGSRNNNTKEPIILKPAYRDKVYLVFIALTILLAYSFFHIFTILPVFYKSEWHFNEQFIGILMALNGVIIVLIEMILVYSLEGTKPLITFIRAGVFLIGVAYAALNLLPPTAWTAVLSMFIITLGEIFAMPFMNSFWISRTTEANRGQYAAIYAMAWSIAQITAPIFGSQLAEDNGYNMVWWMLAAICLFTSVAFSLLGNWLQREMPG
ncbi:MFS transporter [Ilyomonas limi]|uniref:MFS transporter n=1 Tax=Ilyomonas limi TaxID=2575867 RepID=A0A4U3L9H5_9BACT|nr:MFS transporter [Ilyomonas limi]TKK71732.1 MFS transporter [Ilyomonas limi]